MAILKKRTSSRQLPSARGLDRAPLDSIIRGVGSAPSISGGGGSSITSSGGSGDRPFTSVFTNPAVNKPALTTKSSTTNPSLTTKTSLNTKPSLTSQTNTPTTKTTSPATTTKPTITNKTSTTPTTKTTSPTSVVKPSVKPNISNPNSTTNKVVNALTGAAIGAGTKLLVDKITGKPVVKPPTGTTVPKAPTGGTQNPAGGTKNPAGGTTAPAGGTKNPAPTGGTKPPAGGTTSPVVPKSGSGSPTSVIKNPATGLPTGTGFGDDQPEFTTDSLGNTYKTMPDGTSVLYRAAEVAEDEFMTDSLGNVYKTMPDGSYELYRAAEVDEDIETPPPNTGGTDDTSIPSFEPQYFEDSSGNIYISTADGGYELYRAAEVPDEFPEESTVNEEQYYDDGSGNIYRLSPDGGYELYRAAEVPEDIVEEDYNLFNRDNTNYTDYNDYDVNERYSTEEDDGDEYYDFKRGGLTVLMKNGGVPKFANGNIVTEDGMVTDYRYSDEDGSLYKPLGTNEYGEFYAPVLGNQGRYSQGSVASMANSNDSGISYQEAFRLPSGAVDNGDGTYSIGRFTYDMMTDDYLYSSDNGQITHVNSDAVYSSNPEEDVYDTDSFGNIFKNGAFYRAADVAEDMTSISNVGSGNSNATKDRYETDANGNVFKNGVLYRTPEIGGGSTNSIGSDLLNTITGALGTTAGAAGAGALIASLLGSDFSGGTGTQNQGVDMSKVGVINPRTTDFGIGPTNFVGYDDYGTSDGDYTPNEELLRNLNAPGYNPVNEGDYGYEEVAAEQEAPKMASGGLSSMATPVASYYTFGQPADILANLGMRAQPPMNPPEMMPQIGQQQSPQQTQQQGLPQQAPPQMAQQMPQGMPQQGMMPQQQGMPPPMRKGGLPHVSDVPLTQGRMDFRKGAAVHGAGDGQSDDIPAMLADGEYVIDAETVAQIGNGSTKAGAQALDKFRESIRAHKRSAPINKIPPKTKALTSYLKGAK